MSVVGYGHSAETCTLASVAGLALLQDPALVVPEPYLQHVGLGLLPQAAAAGQAFPWEVPDGCLLLLEPAHHLAFAFQKVASAAVVA